MMKNNTVNNRSESMKKKKRSLGEVLRESALLYSEQHAVKNYWF